MASAIFSYLKNSWLFSLLKNDDLKTSNRLVKRLAIPEQTKQFIFAIPDSDSHAVVYILAAQNLSEQSAIDADHLIKEVKPNAVVVSVAPSALPEIQIEGKCSSENQINHIPTSSIGVLKRCLFEKIKKEQYDSFAACQVLQAIFGIGFYGHFLSAKRAADAVDSHFLLLESPYENAGSESVNESSALHPQTNSLLPGKVTPLMSSSSKMLFVSDALESDMVKSLTPSLDLLVSGLFLNQQDEEGVISSNYEVPPFAQSVYSLLVDLHHIFKDLPAIGKALSSAQKMLADVNEGEPVDTKTLSVVQNFRIAIEALRVALNKAARRPMNEPDTPKSKLAEFYNLTTEEKCHVLFAQALKKQAANFGAVVAIVDAASLAGLRKHWSTSVPPEVADLANHCVTHYCNDLDNGEEILHENHEKMKILTDKPVVAFGAGATALVGISSFSKAMPISSLIKAASFHASSSLKIGLLNLQRKAFLGLSKMLLPSKLMAPGISTTTKFAASAEKIRAVTHSMISAAERTSFFAIRTSLYEIMRKRKVRPVGYAPWVSFACSMGACAGLLNYGDGIECAAESVPSVSMIASLGRGLQGLKEASEEVKESRGMKVREALQCFVQSVRS
ncbi:uncharacterized protein LOC110027522 [Phalaenopsis equestris]|uniref:uncharacterized protein LOC110027522 n=1 Tax=Phalaenopsis equestris TaxID=78828 RepID=UPI0009E2498A|nr:uncharacterized protein LOC110027522 [Phalaenopsis equestris]XP_020584653.1 uncharacterized protein LOC110027522 [Phalaenopsis equestris]XP_020584654.1 uncharacterized protein LOC110027522 [Phalaenopsis equestris]XP_020584655.1 uncharacterized protein LOC110027522 [Phalaenopsis equestris]